MMKSLFAVVLCAFATGCSAETSSPTIERDSADAGQDEPEKAIEIIKPASVNKAGGGGGGPKPGGGPASQPTTG